MELEALAFGRELFQELRRLYARIASLRLIAHEFKASFSLDTIVLA